MAANEKARGLWAGRVLLARPDVIRTPSNLEPGADMGWPLTGHAAPQALACPVARGLGLLKLLACGEWGPTLVSGAPAANLGGAKQMHAVVWLTPQYCIECFRRPFSAEACRSPLTEPTPPHHSSKPALPLFSRNGSSHTANHNHIGSEGGPLFFCQASYFLSKLPFRPLFTWVAALASAASSHVRTSPMGLCGGLERPLPE
jgi:hypothetical protein